MGQDAFAKRACVLLLAHDERARLDVHRACAMDGLRQGIQERLLEIELRAESTPQPCDPGMLADMTPVLDSNGQSIVAQLAEEIAWLNENVW